MKKLGKKSNMSEMTIEAYGTACNCSCSGTCSASCKSGSSSKASMKTIMNTQFTANAQYSGPIK